MGIVHIMLFDIVWEKINLPLFYSQLRNFLEDLFSKAVMINTRDSELCISSSVSCSHSAAGVEMAEVQLSTILSAMDVCVSFHTSNCHRYPIQASHPKLTTLSCWWPCTRSVLRVYCPSLRSTFSPFFRLSLFNCLLCLLVLLYKFVSLRSWYYYPILWNKLKLQIYACQQCGMLTLQTQDFTLRA